MSAHASMFAVTAARVKPGDASLGARRSGALAPGARALRGAVELAGRRTTRRDDSLVVTRAMAETQRKSRFVRDENGKLVRTDAPAEDDERRRGPGGCLLYTSPSPRDVEESRMPSSA